MSSSRQNPAATATAIPCILMRGGTSRGPYFNAADFPPGLLQAVVELPWPLSGR